MKVYKAKLKNKGRLKTKLYKVLSKIKVIVALILDGVDLILGNIPLLNSIWDIVTATVLLILLRDKRLALASNIELLLPGLPLLGQIDAFIPIATILTLMDIAKKGIEEDEDIKVIDME
ncbi:hypothetical protein JW930_03415 [Candidatus Woesearchaeota archaeon]|nr:hypothetical protein [Candidatus Woesearchaeota archaeon]